MARLRRDGSATAVPPSPMDPRAATPRPPSPPLRHRALIKAHLATCLIGTRIEHVCAAMPLQLTSVCARERGGCVAYLKMWGGVHGAWAGLGGSSSCWVHSSFTGFVQTTV